MSFYIHVEGRKDRTGCFATYWFGEDTLGAGIQHAVEHVRSELDMREAHAHSVAFDAAEAPPEDTLDTPFAGLRMFSTIQCWDLDPDEQDFIFPVGIVPTTQEGAFEIDEIREAYTTGREGDVRWLRAAIDRRHLPGAFRSCFKALPVADGLEVRLMSHFEDAGKTEVWLAPPDLQDEEIWGYLSKATEDFISNGGVEVAVYSRDAHCTLRLDEHKLLTFYSDDEEHLAEIEDVLQQLSISPTDRFLSIAEQCHHFHYAPPQAKARGELRDQLEQDEFEQVDEWEEQAD